MHMVSMKYKCPYLDVVWITVQQIWSLLRNIILSSHQRGGPNSKHTKGFGQTKIWSCIPTRPGKKECLWWWKTAATYWYAVLFIPRNSCLYCVYYGVCIQQAVQECGPSEKKNHCTSLGIHYNVSIVSEISCPTEVPCMYSFRKFWE